MNPVQKSGCEPVPLLTIREWKVAMFGGWFPSAQTGFPITLLLSLILISATAPKYGSFRFHSPFFVPSEAFLSNKFKFLRASCLSRRTSLSLIMYVMLHNRIGFVFFFFKLILLAGSEVLIVVVIISEFSGNFVDEENQLKQRLFSNIIQRR